MKIGIVSEPLNQPFTGIGNYAFNLISTISEIYGTKHIRLIDYNNKSFHNDPNYLVIPYNKTFEKLSKSYLWYLTLPLKRKVVREFDIVHSLAQYPMYYVSKNQKYVITIHDLIQMLFPKEVPVGSYLIRKFFLPRTLDLAEKIITDSNCTKQDLLKYFKINEDKIIVIPLAANDKFKLLDSKEITIIKTKYQLNYPFIFYVGTFSPRKNIPTLIKAFYNLKSKNIEHKLVFVGKKGNMYDKIIGLVSELNLNNNVIFIENVPSEDLPALYNAADLFVYPSLYEGFGLPPLEAMACGCPVITSSTSSLPEVVGDAGIMVDPYDIDGLADSMYKVLTNEGLSKNMSKNGLDRAKMFSWEKCAEETLKVYEEVYTKC
ncbi:MAG: glycosyltransferase family 1 protein [Methanosarcina sp.]|uniref:glycosyltransferase family 4 protein n=1 Tax=Methanosarcina sp. TaxID=2213 RepID=UPI002632282B|nr:glycosyltransferase family 1 protein [Methanosarcina sp.]MDD3245399.1 glycosyltransferase family 1 protein [Methanosarcina sp.]MDD4247586.1 glycosyltransferase family 1 protein [Methanosarcina sp.]